MFRGFSYKDTVKLRFELDRLSRTSRGRKNEEKHDERHKKETGEERRVRWRVENRLKRVVEITA